MTRLVLLSVLVLLGACEERHSVGSNIDVQASKSLVLTSNYPLYYFANEIAGDAVDVQMPDIDGDPAMWVPGAADIPQLQAADLIVINGAGYEMALVMNRGWRLQAWILTACWIQQQIFRTSCYRLKTWPYINTGLRVSIRTRALHLPPGSTRKLPLSRRGR